MGVVFLVLNVAGLGAEGDSAGAAAPDSTAGIVAPTFAAPFNPPSPDPAVTSPAVRLLGIDVLQDGKIVKGEVALDGSKKAELVTYWCANSEVDSRVPLVLQFMAIRGRVTRDIEISAGPERGQSAWERGTVHRVTHALDLPAVAVDMSGRLDMVLNTTALTSGGFSRAPLQCIPVLVQPKSQQGRVSHQRYAVLFGKDHASLDISFRLGPEAAFTVPIPEAWRGRIGRIAIISAFSFGPIAQGRPVCDVVAKRSDQPTQRWTMRSGENTARTDIDYYPASMQEHRKVEIIESADADYPSLEGGPFKRHMYLGWLNVDATNMTFDTLSVESVNTNFFDVYDIVLVPSGAR